MTPDYKQQAWEFDISSFESTKKMYLMCIEKYHSLPANYLYDPAREIYAKMINRQWNWMLDRKNKYIGKGAYKQFVLPEKHFTIEE